MQASTALNDFCTCLPAANDLVGIVVHYKLNESHTLSCFIHDLFADLPAAHVDPQTHDFDYTMIFDMNSNR